MRTDTNIPTPRTDALQHGGERLDALARELADVDEHTYRAAVEELYMDAAEQLAAARKDSERLKWLFSGYAVARWSHEHEVGAVDRDTLMYSMFDLDDDMKAETEGGER